MNPESERRSAVIALPPGEDLTVAGWHRAPVPNPAALEWPGGSNLLTAPAKDQFETVTTSDWAQVLKDLADLGTQDVFVCGPQLFTRYDALHLLGVARARGLAVSIFTDVNAATPDIADAVAALQLSGIWLTFHGAIAETHDAVAGAGSFDRTMQVLHSLRARHQPVRINALLHAWDLAALADLVGLASQTQCPITSDALLFPHSASDGALPRPALWVMPDGTVRPCRALGSPAGSVPQDSIAELWRTSPQLQALAGLRMTRRPACRECLLRAACFERKPNQVGTS